MAHCETEERALWSAVLALEEAANLVAAVGPQFGEEAAARLRGQIETRLKQAQAIRAVLRDLEPFQIE